MPPELRQEALSRAYLEAVAAHAGVSVSYPRTDFGIDATLSEIALRRGQYAESGTKFDIQLKSIGWDGDITTDFGYDLTVRAFEQLRQPVEVPRLLIVFVVPETLPRWTELGTDWLAIRRRACRVSLRGLPAIPNKFTVRVTVPAAQPFAAPQLLDLIARAKRGDFR